MFGVLGLQTEGVDDLLIERLGLRGVDPRPVHLKPLIDQGSQRDHDNGQHGWGDLKQVCTAAFGIEIEVVVVVAVFEGLSVLARFDVEAEFTKPGD